MSKQRHWWWMRPATRNDLESFKEQIMALLDNLEAEVTELTTVTESAVKLLQRLSEQIKAAGTDPVKLKALTAQLDQNTSVLAAAVAANTPADEEPPVEPS